MKKLLYIFAITPFFLFSQVGINTTTPQETLHVEGTMCITDTSTKTPTRIAGMDANGTVAEITVGANLQLTGNVLSANAVSASSPTIYLVTNIAIPTGPPGEQMNDLDLDLPGSNVDKVVFRLTGRTNNYKITGISGGTDGRHLVLYNVESVNLTLVAESTDSLPANRLETLANNVATSGKGTAEFVYDGASQRWILIGFRD